MWNGQEGKKFFARCWTLQENKIHAFFCSGLQVRSQGSSGLGKRKTQPPFDGWVGWEESIPIRRWLLRRDNIGGRHRQYQHLRFR
jgi:hypothetical protein